MEYQCGECLKCFNLREDVLSHIRLNHRARPVTCYHCGFTTKFKKSLCRHITASCRQLHPRRIRSGTLTRKVSILECPMCKSFLCRSRDDMIQHYSEEHDVDISEKRFEFANIDAFNAWKKEIETSNCFRFTRVDGKKNRSGETKRFRCTRDGFFISQGENRRRPRVRGSCKIDGVCPCSLKIYVSNDTGAVNAFYVSSHVAHGFDIGLVQSKGKKHSHSIPSNSKSDSVDETDNIIQQPTTRKDLTDTKESYKLFQVTNGRLHSDDRASLEAWMYSLNNYSEILRFYKPQSTVLQGHPELQPEDFVLILAYDAQIEMLKKFGGNVICFDGTHGTNPQNFEFHTLLVKDGQNEGFPCAFLLSNRSDSQVMALFVNIIRNLLPQPLEPKVMMTDVSEIYFDGWYSVLPEPRNWLFCEWHVDQAWRQSLNKVGNRWKKTYVHKLVRAVMDEPDEATFHLLLQRAVDILAKDPELTEFHEYFKSTYCPKIKAWARCFQKDLEVDPDIMLECMYKIIKLLYLDGKKVKRLDQGVNDLLQFVREKIHEESSATARISEMRDRHARSLVLNTAIIHQESSPNWLVASSSRALTYEVTKIADDCDCEDKCEECDVCVHQYRCTCTDSMLSNLCKHIHKVVSTSNQAKLTESPVKSITIGNEQLANIENYWEQAYVTDFSANIPAAESTSIPEPETSSNLDQAKDELMQQLASIIQTATSVEAIDAIKRAIVQGGF